TSSVPFPRRHQVGPVRSPAVRRERKKQTHTSTIQNMTLTDRLRALHSSNGCFLATNFYNFATLAGVMVAASQLKQPIILQVTKGSIDYLGLPMAVGMAKAALAGHEAGGWLHLDHAESYDLIARCLDAGFDSVMIDYSERPFHEN